MTSYIASGSADLEGTITSLGLRTVGVSALVLILLLIIASQTKDRFPRVKLPLFVAIATVIGGSTIFLFASTIYLNVVSDSGGPVHWHADIEYWACGTELEIRDPYQFLSNKVGSPVLHEHNDKRIHLEGVVVDLDRDATIGHFMETIGGSLSRERITIPIADDRIESDKTDGDVSRRDYIEYLESKIKPGADGGRYIELTNNDSCGGEPAEVQVFVYQYDEESETYKQTKLTENVEVLQQVGDGEYEVVTLASAKDYIYSDYSNVPPGDCVIFEFDAPKDFTDKLCKQYGLKDVDRCMDFGVLSFNPKQCNIRDVTDYTQTSTQQSADISTDTANTQQVIRDDEYCAPFVDANGDFTGVEIAALKPDGSIVNPSIDCVDYQNFVRGGGVL